MADEIKSDTVWIVEQGDYSDYTVLGVCQSEEHAKEVADWYNHTQNNCYEVTVSQLHVYHGVPKMGTYHNLLSDLTKDELVSDDIHDDRPDLGNLPIYEHWNTYTKKVVVSGFDRERAVKILADRRAFILQEIAEGRTPAGYSKYVE